MIILAEGWAMAMAKTALLLITCLLFTRSRGVMLPYDQPRYYGPPPYGPNGENGR
jgi:hypothetical protein